jgi:lysophospholipase L1-like esterase
MRLKLRDVLGGAMLALWLVAPASAAEWITSWAAAPMPGLPTPLIGPVPFSLNNQTLRQVLHLSAGGTRLRIRFTNEYGGEPLKIGAATITRIKADGSLDRDSMRKLTFSGQSSAIVPAEAPLLSDPVDLPVKALSDVSLSIYFPEDTGLCTCHHLAMQDAFVSAAGDFTATDFPPAQTVQSRGFISDVEVQVPHGKTIVVLGDSISDGVGSTPNANRRWPDVLARRLNTGAAAWGVANEGISGNRVLEDGAGPSALSRLDRDVLALPGVGYVIVFIGVNDLGLSYGTLKLPSSNPNAPPRVIPPPANLATAATMIAGYRQIIARVHAHGIKVYGATIAPYEGAMYWAPAGESVRKAINEWIRHGGEFDAVLDFDLAFRDPARPTRMAETKTMGDYLHGNDAGYQAVGNSIDLKLFR